MTTYRDLTGHGIPTRTAASLVGLPRATATRTPRTRAARQVVVPANRLDVLERARILTVVNSARFVDLPPIQIYAQLLDEGVYLASISTIYRVLAENQQVKERRRLARHPARAIPELVATGPGQVYTWDITKLPGPIKGKYFDAYVMIDIYSRYIVGVKVHPAESAVLAAEMMTETFSIHGTPQVVHADRGTSMTSKTVAALLSDLEVTKSHSRPRVSNDNPYSESWFKTLKFAPVFPESFGSLGRCPMLHEYLCRGLQPQPQPPAHRDRAQHPCRRPLRPRRRQGRRAGGDPRHRARPEPRALQHRLRPEDPRHPRRGLDQQASRTTRGGAETSRLNSRWPHSP